MSTVLQILFNKNIRKRGKTLIYDKIKQICDEKGVTVSSVEKKAGLSNGAISKWNTSSPTIENLQSVANVLKVKLEKILK